MEAARQGHATAAPHVRQLFYAGEDGTQLYARAYFYWKLANDKNVSGADNNLVNLAKVMAGDDGKGVLELRAGCSK